ncbi:MAG: glycosyltransferase family 2 protein [Desulfovibrio sp.]|jgi:glycosyltransferase involved in cell wall biosynthesis|nr:glycosyltransferase family 2 protein [Desulfovibrio sp.]
MPVLSIVSPVYCEGAHIHAFLDAVEEAVAPLGLGYEIILVDDGSKDDSFAQMRKAAQTRPFLRCLRLSRNFGKEAALAAGLETATGDAVITLDADLQHPPALIPEMVRLWRENTADVIEAHKEKRQKESLADRMAASLFYRLFFLFTSIDIKGAGDFKLLDRKVVQAWKSMPERKVFYRGMISWLGFRHYELPFVPAERQSGAGKWSFLNKIRLALDSITAFSSKPLTLIWLLGLVFFLFSILVGAETLWKYFTGQAMDGFTTVILLILVTGASILSAICILSVYIRQNFHELKGRPRYLISERIGYSGREAETGGSGVEADAEKGEQDAPWAERHGVAGNEPGGFVSAGGAGLIPDGEGGVFARNGRGQGRSVPENSAGLAAEWD